MFLKIVHCVIPMIFEIIIIPDDMVMKWFLPFEFWEMGFICIFYNIFISEMLGDFIEFPLKARLANLAFDEWNIISNVAFDGIDHFIQIKFIISQNYIYIPWCMSFEKMHNLWIICNPVIRFDQKMEMFIIQTKSTKSKFLNFFYQSQFFNPEFA